MCILSDSLHNTNYGADAPKSVSNYCVAMASQLNNYHASTLSSVSTLDSVEWRVDYLLGSSALQVEDKMQLLVPIVLTSEGIIITPAYIHTVYFSTLHSHA